MAVDPRAGRPAAETDLVDVAALVTAYYSEHPDPSVPEQRVTFGTSGHRGSALRLGFNDDHIAAAAQAVSEHRARAGIDGPLYLGRDSHALSEPATVTALEVFVANGVDVLVDSRGGIVPTPAVSLSILLHNARGAGGTADGVVVTPSHNPPEDGGFKYNPPDGGPAGSDITRAVQDRANELLAGGNKEVRRVPHARARDAVRAFDYLDTYVRELPAVVDLDAIRSAGVRIGAHPLGGASAAYWGAIADRFGLDLTVVDPRVDPTFRYMTLDWDGRIRMDCSSPYAMASLIERAGDFDIATGNDADADRHGVVTPDAGLMNPNHYLATAIDHLFRPRGGWAADAGVGKTMVSSSMIDRVAAELGRRLVEVPVGFKWFVPGLLDGSIGFGGEESAGASFLRRDGGVWTTDKDGIVLALLAAEITAVTGSSPSRRYAELTARHGDPAYARIDAPASPAQKVALAGALPRAGRRRRAGRRAGPGAADRRPRQRRPPRRAQGRHGVGLVRRPPVGYRGRLQALRGVVPWAGASGPDPAGGTADRRRRPRRGRSGGVTWPSRRSWASCSRAGRASAWPPSPTTAPSRPSRSAACTG
jgi:phosphoglucomutase